jgi:hypothetical protein
MQAKSLHNLEIGDIIEYGSGNILNLLIKYINFSAEGTACADGEHSKMESYL